MGMRSRPVRRQGPLREVRSLQTSEERTVRDDPPDLEPQHSYLPVPAHLDTDQHPARCDPHPARAAVGHRGDAARHPVPADREPLRAGIADNGPGWLHLVVLWSIWNGLKMLWIGPVSVILLIGARLRERAERRRQQRAEVSETTEESRADALVH